MTQLHITIDSGGLDSSSRQAKEDRTGLCVCRPQDTQSCVTWRKAIGRKAVGRKANPAEPGNTTDHERFTQQKSDSRI